MAKYYSWENLQNKPDEMDRFIGLIKGIDDLISSKVDNRLKDFAGQLLAMKKNPTLPDAQEMFDRGIEMLGDRLGYYNEAYKDEYSEKIEKMKGLKGYRELEAELPLAMNGTLGYEAESIRDQLYDYKTEGTVAYPGTEQLFHSFAAIYEIAKGKKNWKQIKSESLVEGDNALGKVFATEFQNRAGSVFIPDSKDETKKGQEYERRLFKMITEETNGSKVSEFLYYTYIQDASKRINEYRELAEPGAGMTKIYPRPYQTSNDKPWDELSSEEREKRQVWDKKEQKRSAKIAADTVAQIMACREVSQLKPEKGKTFWDAGRFGKNVYETMLKVTPDLVANVPREELGRVILASKDGSALERFMRQHYVARDTALPEDLPKFLRPTAKERIEELQRRIKSKETDAEQKRSYAIEIMAVREAVDAQRGGAGLDAKLPNDIQDRVYEIQRNIGEMFYNGKLTNPDQDFEKLLLADATSGHGGKMTENYYKYYGMHINKQSMDSDLPKHLDDKLMPTAKNRIEAMQARLRNAEGYEAEALNKEIAKSVAGILAARENVNAQRGGKGLNKKLRNAEALAERTKELAEKLSVLDGETLGMLRDQALSGHGGEMKKTFESDAIQNKIMKGMKARIDKQARDKAFEDGMKKSFEAWKKAQEAARIEYDKKLAERQQNLQNAKTPDEQETYMSEVLYLNTLKRVDDPATLRTEMMLDKEENIDRVKQGAEKLRGTATYQKFFKKMMSKEALEEAKKGNFEKLTGEWDNAVQKEKVFTQKMAEQQKKLNGGSAQTREQGMAGILYLNSMLEKPGPAKQDHWMKPEAMDQAVKEIKDSKVFKDGFAKSVSAKAIQEAKNGKIEKMVGEWEDAVLKVEKPITQTFEQTKPLINKSKNFQGKDIVLPG